ncbi:MAG: hypothetical protein HY719_04605 [Planctomycetes bacterium]|nr:hypothetical protein [Planctomycetota bacterium]
MTGGVFVLDTNMLIAACAHRNRTVWDAAEANFGVGKPESTLLICVVSVEEFRSFAVHNKWGSQRLNDLNAVLDRVTTIDIHD